MKRSRLLSLVSLVLAALGCDKRTSPAVDGPTDHSRAASSAPKTNQDSSPVTKSLPSAAQTRALALSELKDRAACDARIAAIRSQPQLPGTPEFDKQRELILARTKGEPVTFVRAPKFDKADRIAVAYRRSVVKARFPSQALERILPRLKLAPAVGARAFLAEGYLYAEHPAVAHALTKHLELRHVTDAPKVRVQRATTTWTAQRTPTGSYRFVDGPHAGDKATLLMLDRVLPGDGPVSEPLHRDVQTLHAGLGFDSMRFTFITQDAAVAELKYGSRDVTTLLERKGVELTMGCERVEATDAAAASHAIHHADRRVRVLNKLRSAIDAQVAEKLPFDEPTSEWGQQDGHLKHRWVTAYEAGEKEFVFNYDRYQVFTSAGAPRVPQVCIDFISHTLERASGTWWNSAGEARGRRVGGLDFDTLVPGNRRQVMAFVEYAKQAQDGWQVFENPDTGRVPFQFRRQFFAGITRNKERYRPGDVVIIRGYAPWDMNNVEHSHSFFIYQSDPVTGMPLRLAGNAGIPKITRWEEEMSRAPRRSIRYRLRPSLSWLESAFFAADRG